VSAHRIEDGSLLRKQTMPMRGGNHPAVGKLADGSLVVVALMGDIGMPPIPEGAEKAAIAFHGPLRNAVFALDAGTGETLWSSEEAPWPHVAGAGGTERHAPERQDLAGTMPKEFP